jgi:hypothetical protein
VRRSSSKYVWVIVFAAISSVHAAVDVRPGEYRGYYAVNRLVKTQILAPDAGLNLGRYLNEDTEYPDSLSGLLGAYLGGSESEFRNGQPNPLSFLLWTTILRGFSQEVGSVCTVPAKSKLFETEFARLILRACADPRAFAAVESNLRLFWTRLTAFEVPGDEFDKWLPFARERAAQAGPQEAVSDWVLGAQLNPYFLLQL